VYLNKDKKAMILEDDVDPLVAPLDQRQSDQNPLRMLEVLMKGLCPTIITDQVEIHFLQPHNDQKAECRSPPVDACQSPDSPFTTSESSLTTVTDKHYFEIGERPPSDVIGISKKLWENFCYNPYDSNRGRMHHPHHKGFCGILTDRLCHKDDFNNEEGAIAPDGEECSINSEASLDADLSPQASPSLSSSDEMLAKLAEGDDINGVEDQEEADEIPIAEFLYPNKRHTRRLQVLVSTCLALFMTFVLLQKFDTVHEISFHFAVANKEMCSTYTGQNSLSSAIVLSKRWDGVPAKLESETRLLEKEGARELYLYQDGPLRLDDATWHTELMYGNGSKATL
jgi:hypothetical protein